MRTETYTAPSHWAPYLINGDASGLDEGERQAADDWIEAMGCGVPVSCEDAGFCRFHDALEESPYASDCQRYTFCPEYE